MNTCVQPSALKELADSTLSIFDQAILQLPTVTCSEFFMQARTLKTDLLMIYRIVVITVRDEDDLDKISSLWGVMVWVCDKFADKLGALTKEHPHCGAEIFYDYILDLKNKCQRLQRLHA